MACLYSTHFFITIDGLSLSEIAHDRLLRINSNDKLYDFYRLQLCRPHGKLIILTQRISIIGMFFTNPYAINSFSCSISIFWVIFCISFFNVDKQLVPFPNCQRMTGFHFPFVISWVSFRRYIYSVRTFILPFTSSSFVINGVIHRPRVITEQIPQHPAYTHSIISATIIGPNDTVDSSSVILMCLSYVERNSMSYFSANLIFTYSTPHTLTHDPGTIELPVSCNSLLEKHTTAVKSPFCQPYS